MTEEDWREKLSDTDVVKAYISAFVGEDAERDAMSFLANNGIVAEQFASKIHAHTDLAGSDGVEYSVKSYASENLHSLRNEIRESDAQYYVVNTEAYEGLASKGQIAEYEEDGIQIIDGGFSHQDDLELATEHLSDRIDDAISPIFDHVLDDVPIVGAIVAAASIGNVVVEMREGKLSKAEALGEIGTDIGKFAASGAGATAGAVSGAMAGSVVFPLAGTLIGGFVGGIAGAMGARSFLENRRYKHKWPVSDRTHKHFATAYHNGLSEYSRRKIGDILFKRVEFQREIEDARAKRKLRVPKRRFLVFNTLDVTSVFLAQIEEKLESQLAKLDDQVTVFAEWLMDYAIESGIEMYPEDKRNAFRAAQRIYGALLSENVDWLLQVDEKEIGLLKSFQEEIQKSPNNPYQAFALNMEQLRRHATLQQMVG